MQKLNPENISLNYGELAPEVVLPPPDRFDLAPDAEARALYHREKFAVMTLAVMKKAVYPQLMKVRTTESGFERDGYFVPVRVYHPVEPGGVPVLVLYHGGGWAINDINIYDYVCRYLAYRSGAVIFSVDYRLAPQHKFPVGLEDCYGATQWVFDNAAKAHGGDPNRISVAGDSAGGNYAAVVSMTARDSGDFPVANQILIYPGLDLTETEYYSLKRYAKGYFLEIDLSGPNIATEMYLQDLSQASDPRVSPMLAQDFRGLPRTQVISAESDPIVDHAVRYAKLLSAAEVPVDFYLFEGMPHGFITDNYGASFQAMDLMCDLLRGGS